MKRTPNKFSKAVRKRAPHPQTRSVLGIAWYRAEQWPRLRAVAADAEALHDTYAEWEQAATEQLHKLRALGIEVRPVVVDVDEMLRWCREHNRAFDGEARSTFVAEKVGAASKEHQ